MYMMDATKKRIQAQLHEWRAKLDQIDAQLEQKEADLQLEQEVENLRSRLREYEKKYQDLQKRGSEVWITFKASLDSATNEFQDGMMRVVNKLKNG